MNAGVDMEMAIADAAYARLPEAIEAGTVTEEALDASVRRVLEAKLRLGLFDDPYVDEERAREVLADPAHRDVARIAAERSAVLLRNEGDLLPLDAAAVGSIAVIGPLADSKRDTLGPWVLRLRPRRDGHRARRHPRRVGDRATRRLRARRAARRSGSSRRCSTCSPATRRRTRPASTTRPSSSGRSTSARDADVAVVVVGEWQHMIGEAASRSSLELPGRQLELLQAVAETGTPVVLLVMNGRPLDLRWAAEHVPAILDIWYPGTQGGAAVANLLFGDVSPGRQAAVHLAADGRAGADDLRPHPSRTSRTTRHGATGTRRARRCSRSATG